MNTLQERHSSIVPVDRSILTLIRSSTSTLFPQQRGVRNAACMIGVRDGRLTGSLSPCFRLLMDRSAEPDFFVGDVLQSTSLLIN